MRVNAEPYNIEPHFGLALLLPSKKDRYSYEIKANFTDDQLQELWPLRNYKTKKTMQLVLFGTVAQYSKSTTPAQYGRDHNHALRSWRGMQVGFRSHARSSKAHQ